MPSAHVHRRTIYDVGVPGIFIQVRRDGAMRADSRVWRRTYTQRGVQGGAPGEGQGVKSQKKTWLWGVVNFACNFARKNLEL